ncbi:MAG: PEP-CTERM sorting domain-containing protein [Planctomycetota bacterium]|nr:PEP-CTERM sorting domain-containing protein [Planctomycetota bacterium]
MIRSAILSALVWAAASLICTTAALADEVVPKLEPVQYVENVYFKGATDYQMMGEDIIKPESIGIVYPGYTYPTSGHTYDVNVFAMTMDRGPVSNITAQVIGKNPGNNPGYTTVQAGSTATVISAYVVYNKWGTEHSQDVPLILEGSLVAKVDCADHGLKGSLQSTATTSATVQFYDASGTRIFHQGAAARNDWDPDDWFQEVSWSVDVVVPLGTKAGVTAWFLMVQQANALVGAWTYGGHEPGYGEAHAWAIADPLIYIDPTWEHADEFGIAFPDNVTFIPEPATLAILALGGVVVLNRRR